MSKVEIFLEQREVAFLSLSKICENLNFSTVHLFESPVLNSFFKKEKKNPSFLFKSRGVYINLNPKS